MRLMKRNIIVFVLVLSILCCDFLVAPCKADTPYMKKMNVTWDLKKDKLFTYRNCYGGIGLQDEYAKIIKFKKKSVGDEYKITMKIRFECIRTLNEMSKKKRDKFLRFSDGDGFLGDYNVVIADYKTGKCLYVKNKFGVKADCDYEDYKEKTFYSSDYDYSETVVNSYAYVTITYPKSYKNLCIGIGGSSSFEATMADEDYYNGEGSFKKTSFNCKKDKGVMHFMRVK